MKFKTLIIPFIILTLLVTLVVGSLSYSANRPLDLTKQVSSSVAFGWIPTITGENTIIPSYLYITEHDNETHFILNQTIKHCMNASACNVTVSGFEAGYYQWYIVSGDASLQANMTGNESYPLNTTANNNLTFYYSHNGTDERCSLALTSNDFANSSDIVNDISSGCENLTAYTPSNVSEVYVTGPDWGVDAYINIFGNASSIVGFWENASGSQTNVSSLATWFEILVEVNNTNFLWDNDTSTNVMKLNKNTGDLWLLGNLTVGNIAWSNFSNYPVACPAGSAITQLGDTIICSDFWVDTTGDDMNGTLNMTNNNITNVNYIIFENGGYIRDNSTTLILGHT